MPQSNSYRVTTGGPRGPRRYLDLTLEPADDFEQMGDASLRQPTTPEDESLVLEHVHPGRYWVRPYAAVGYVSSITSGGIDLSREPLVVPVGGSVPPIEVKLRDDSAFIVVGIEGSAPSAGGGGSGELTVPSGQLRGGSGDAFVYCMSAGDAAGYFAQMNISTAVGQSAQIAVPPGAYHLLAFRESQPNLEFRNSEAMRAYDGKGAVVRLGPGEKQQVQLQAIPPIE